MRNQALAPAGVKNLKQRVNDRKGRQKEQMIGQKRHEDAMREMAKRKAEQLQKKTGINAAARNTKRTTAPARGAAAGVKTNNKYMQEFNKMKNANNKRKEDFTRGGGAPSTRKSTQGGIDNRFNSQTAPAYSSKINQNLTAAAARSGRIPKAAPAPMTRRTNQMPTKRPNALDAHNKTAPAAPHIAVTGMGGLRAIKAGLHNNKGR